MKIAITGPTGNIGRQLVRLLQDQGEHELILLARHPEKLEAERQRGARVTQGDLKDPDYVREATQGANALFWLIPPNLAATNFREYQREVTRAGVSAVQANQIPHVVLLSSIGAHLESGTGPILGLHDAEQQLGETGTKLTVLRPAYFMENHLFHLETIQQMQSIFLPLPGDTSIPMVATVDIAAAAAKALTETNVRETHVLPLHGPRDHSFAEVAGVMGETLGQKIRLVQVPPEQARQSMIDGGMSEDVADQMLELQAALASGHLQDEFPRTKESTTPTMLREFMARALKGQGAAVS